MPESTEPFPSAGSFLRTEGFFNEILLNSQMSFAMCALKSAPSFSSQISGLDETLFVRGFGWEEILRLTDS